MPRIGRVVSLILLLPAFVLLAPDESFLARPAAANAQGLMRNLIARLRGETMPDGIVKANGLIEAARAVVSSKYPGRITEISVKEGAQATIGQALAHVSSPEADVTLVSPRDGEVQDVTAETGDTIAPGEPIATIVDLTDLNMTVFLPAADAGKLAIGDEARVILDAAPDYVIPAVVSFVASDARVSPKAVETKEERAKQMFRVNLRIDPQVVKTYGGKVEPGLPGAGFVRTKPDVKWPPELQIKLPPTPVAQEAPPPPPRCPSARATTRGPCGFACCGASADAGSSSGPRDARCLVSRERFSARARRRSAKTWVCSGTGSCDGRCGAINHVNAAGAGVSADRQFVDAGCRGGRGGDDIVRPCGAGRDGGVRSQSVNQLAGAWAPPGADCKKIFQRKGRALTYRQPADPFMKAVIVDPQRIRLPSATCELDSAVRDGGSLKLIAECADVISYTSRTVYVTLRSNDELVYSPTGDPVFATNLMRCPI